VGKIAIVTDSNTCLPQDIIEKYQIGIVPIVLIFKDEILRDGVDIDIQGFYARLRTADPLPTTSSPTPTQFIETFEEARSRGADGIVVVTLSSKLSMSYNAAHLAIQDMEGIPIRVVDSRMATIAQGFVALTAAEAAAQGLELDDVVALAEKSTDDIGFAVMLDTLDYLHRGGRVPAIAALVGSAIKLNPVLGNRMDGTVGIISPSLGPKAATNRILKEVEQKAKDRKLKRLAVMHADAMEKAKSLMEIVVERFKCDEIYLVELTPVMGAHAGPGVVGLAYQIEDLPTDQNVED
jgi:DegV family protein with EDD domain